MKVRAAVSREAGRHPAIETLEIEEPRADEVLVRIVATGICHTDLSINAAPAPKPIVLGHEGAGVVERVGRAVTRVKPGDPVVIGPNFCGRCPTCRRNATSYCYESMTRNFGALRPDGSSPLSADGSLVYGRFFGQSSFSTYSLADERAVIPAPADLSLEVLGPLGCGVHTGAGAVVNSLKVGPGQSIAVFGTGSVGLSAIMAARLVGASRIVAVDLIPARLQLARELGATDAIDGSPGTAADAIRELTTYGVDFSLNTTHSPAVYTQAVACLAHEGVAGFVTTPAGEWRPDLGQLLSGGRRLQGIIGGSATPSLFIPMLIDYFRQGRFPFDRLITFYPFEHIDQALTDVEAGHTIKAVLRVGDQGGGLR
ncbi:MAG: NAD(P)-dependent alcohol dehydrogenase [Candidatus Dormibacteraeota bacterium]|nr:NAD(P)-dependent alcohol dehydrogenase [Candidatus Dormibacteraeota bacterium]